MKLISLALPIFNGEKCVGLTLQSIIDAFKKLSFEEREWFEIVVSDNSSVDKTQRIVEEFRRSGLNISYFFNDENVGYDRNIDLLVQRSNAKYVWFLGCGERLKEDALKRLLKVVNTSSDYTNILVDFDIFDEKQNKIVEKHALPILKDILIEEKDDFSYIKYGAAVSSNIVNRKKWQQVSHHKLVVDGWCHVERILDMIALEKDSKTVLLSQPYFTLYREKDGWWTKENSYLLLLLHIDVLKSMYEKGYSRLVVQQLIKMQSRGALLMAVLQSKEYGLKVDKKIVKNMLSRFKKDYFFWLFVMPLLLLPKESMSVFRGIFKSLKKLKRFT